MKQRTVVILEGLEPQVVRTSAQQFKRYCNSRGLSVKGPSARVFGARRFRLEHSVVPMFREDVRVHSASLEVDVDENVTAKIAEYRFPTTVNVKIIAM